MSTQDKDQEDGKTIESQILQKEANVTKNLNEFSEKKEATVVEAEKVKFAENEDTPAAKSGDTPVAKTGDTPAAKSKDTQVAKSGDTPVAKSGDTPVAKSEDKPMAKSEEAVKDAQSNELKENESQGTLNRARLRKTRQSINSKQSEISFSSFTELVAINKEGHPYVDINRLIYRPIPNHQHHRYHHRGHFEDDTYTKEKLGWYLPDFSFILFNIMSLCVSTYFCLIGGSTLTWKASIGMFSVPPCWDLLLDNSSHYVTPNREQDFFYLPCRRFTKDAGGDFGTTKGYNFHKANSFPILRTKLTDAHYFGLVLICIELVNAVNVIVGINACLQGYKGMLVQHIIVDMFIVMAEFVISAVVAVTSICDTRDLKAVREILKEFVHWYGLTLSSPELESDKEKQINVELEALQVSLGCCGVDGWIDYLAARYPEHNWYQSISEQDSSELVIPHSCCKSWWIRNIYCSHGAHLWSHPLASKEDANRFQERIVQDGCIYKLEKLCINLQAAMGKYGFFATMIHLAFISIEAAAAGVLIKNINKLIRVNKSIMRRKEMLQDDDEDEVSDIESEVTVSVTKDDKDKEKINWSKVAPPTEDEIITIKQRSNFNNFMCRMKGGLVGKWMQEAREIVAEGHEEQQDEYITAEERKQREKELLHAAKSKIARRGTLTVTQVSSWGFEKAEASIKGKRVGTKRSKIHDEKKKLKTTHSTEHGTPAEKEENADKLKEAQSKATVKRSAELEHKKHKHVLAFSNRKVKSPRNSKEKKAKKSMVKELKEEEMADEPPTPLTIEETLDNISEWVIPDVDQEETAKKKIRRKRRKKRKKRRSKPDWQGTWYW